MPLRFIHDNAAERAKARSDGRGFTLMETLLVVAVIAILASLVLPALARSRKTARRAQCVSNLRQLGLAAQMYWDDHEGWSFHYRAGETNGGDIYWFGWISRGAEGSRAMDHSQGVLFPYLEGRGVEICPSLRYEAATFKLKAQGAAYGYGYNLELSPKPARPPLSIRSLPRPSSTALFADAAQVNDFQAPASPDNPMLEEFYYVSPLEPTTHFRHEGSASVVYCDGHVEKQAPVEGSIDQRLPAENVGRLPRAALAITPTEN
ncbi:MAG: DUF1559 domain-containing protein [Verrucomicrobia bacterium]|nr:DUF1559 domain-containing protein [Verrucomicrobiota bacterium]MBI3867773.1 DUF1559 domain-containing protein [Verrucomicrobiota bacterium]